MNIITRREAKKQGSKRYYTAQPCKRGHISYRLVSDKTCHECTLEWKRKNGMTSYRKYRQSQKGKTVRKAAGKRYSKTEKAIAIRNTITAKRRATKQKATPCWYQNERSQIQALYEEARQLTKQTKVNHHVDHYIPLEHELVCGLHTLANLQILTAEENVKKSNSFAR